MEPIYATQMKIRKSVLHLTVRSQNSLKDSRLYLVKQETDPSAQGQTILPFDCTARSENTIEAVLDIALLEMEKVDWSILAIRPDSSEEKENSGFQAVILNGKLRALLILGNYQIRRDSWIIFPMGSTGHQLILRCRRRTIYDGQGTRIKEFLAYGIYRLTRPLWKKKRIWLIFEKYCVSAQDNGFYFFRYCMEQLGEKDRKRIYFILDPNSVQWDTVKKYRENVLPFMSFRHILYMLAASLYVASDSRIHGYHWQPKPNLISREINRHDIYFLQHGVLALKRVENLFGKKGVCPVTYFTTSSQYEQDIVVREFGYKASEAPVVGLARWDVLENRAKPDVRKILIMPTWRSWLEYLSDEEFRKSSYYRRYLSLMENPTLLSFLEKKNVELIFYIHPKLRNYIESFRTESSSSRVRLIPFGESPLNELLMECSMMVTDYSSACWDVFYQEKPVLFYQFDLDLYMETNGSYIDMETELFGERCINEEDLIEKLKAYGENGFHEKAVYGAMREKYFAFRDHHNCERTYRYIIGRGY